MLTQIATGQKLSRRCGAETAVTAEFGIATVWLVFYVVALGIAISSPLISAAVEFAALTAE